MNVCKNASEACGAAERTLLGDPNSAILRLCISVREDALNGKEQFRNSTGYSAQSAIRDEAASADVKPVATVVTVFRRTIDFRKLHPFTK